MSEQHIDPASLAAVLSADYPLIDPPLIYALLSDYAPTSLSSHLPDIREQLGILEATLVPDPDDEHDAVHSEAPESWTESTSASGVEGGLGIDGLSGRLESLTTATDPTTASGSRTTWTDSTKGSSSKSEDSDKDTDEMELLKSLFPAFPDEEIQSILSTSLGLQPAIDHLLSLELIRNVEAEGHWPGEEEGTDGENCQNSESRPRSRSPSKSKSKKNNKSKSKSKPKVQSQTNLAPFKEVTPIILTRPKFEETAILSPSTHSRTSTEESASSISVVQAKKKKNKQVIQLVDTMQRGHRVSPLPSQPTSRSAFVNGRGRSDNGSTSRARSTSRSESQYTSRRRSRSPIRNGPSSNAWHTVSSLSSYLSDMLSHPQNYFLSYLHAPDYHSAYTAVRASLAALPSASNPAASSVNDGDAFARKVLEDMYGLTLSEREGGPSVGRRELEKDLELCVHAAGEDVATVMDLMELLSEISEWPGDDDVIGVALGLESRQELTLNKSARSSAISLSITPQLQSAAQHQLQLQPVAVSMSRTSSAGSTVGSLPPSPIMGSSTQLLPSAMGAPSSTLPGKVTRAKKKNGAPVVPEVPLTGGAIREAKTREVPGSKPSLTSVTHPTALDSFGIQSPTPSSPKPRRDGPQLHPQNWRTVSHARPSGQATGAGGERVRKMTVEECMAQAQLERSRRETAIRAAGRHFKYSATGMAGGGRSAKGAVAGHYANQARKAAERAKAWELRAARIVVESHLGAPSAPSTGSRPQAGGTSASSRAGGANTGSGGGGGNGNLTYDLHHLTVSQATEIVSEITSRWWATEKEHRAEKWNARTDGRLVFITGVGRHSVKGQGVLGPKVAGYLENEGWRVDRGDSERGYLVVRGKK